MRDDWDEFFTGGRSGMGPATVRSQVEKFLDEAKELHSTLAETSGAGYGPRRLAGVRVGSNGRVVETIITENHASFTAREISDEVTAAAAAAHADLTKKLTEGAAPITQVFNAIHDFNL